MGEEVEKFEIELSKFFDRPSLCVINGTSALHLALQASGVKKGDEVLVPSLTYIASYQAISATGAKPISCDVNKDNLLLDLNDAHKRLTTSAKAIMPVHFAGDVGDLNAVYRFAKKNKLAVIEDAAHAFGTIYNGEKVGSFGNIACFSFDGIKNITSGEGGCIVSDDKKIIRKIKDARLLGVEKDSEKRYKRQRSWDFDVSQQGWRCHMSNIMAAIGLEQLKRLPEFSIKRKQLAKEYDNCLKHKKIKLFKRDYENIVPHIYVLRIVELENRKDLLKKMLKKGIELGYHYQPNHILSLYSGIDAMPLPVTDLVSSEIISLPLHPDLSIEDIRFISESLIEILN